MNIGVGQSIDSNVYIENDYRGLAPENLARVDSITWIRWFQIWLESLSKNTEIPPECELSLRLTSDRQIQQYNQQYRSFDKPTDVLAFAALESTIALPVEIEEPVYLGDIIISLDTALAQAKSQKHSLTTELAWLSSHGLLHLLGWDHPDDNSLQDMLKEQSKLIHLLNTSDLN